MAQKPGNRAALVALGLLLVVGAFFVWGRVFAEDTPGDYRVRKGNYRLEDGRYEQAIEEFEAALETNPGHLGAHLGRAITHGQMGELELALAELDRTLELDPGLAPAWANRGILRDRLGRHAEALADYRRALELDPRLAKGPGYLWRFLRNVGERPPTIADRADYLEAELAKPPAERLLRLPEEDAKQRMYKVD
ncbi:MAG: tetratricopeptide repeat protein [Acidobacteriota bacterium]|nr:tetratricopeptide repeat protein [Acidobacteriota bacterium]MDH3524120.1 tetratricopeptide repeat protein [Acidobacteriota bacterium]